MRDDAATAVEPIPYHREGGTIAIRKIRVSTSISSASS
jgi:hypothetical protein